MQQGISVHNFGPITDFELTLQKFNVLTGPQASGKSTIAKLVFFCKTVKNEMLIQASARKNALFSIGFKRGLEKRLRGKFLNMFGSTWAMPMDMRIIYDYCEDVWIKIFLEKDHNNPDKNFVKFEYSDSLTGFLDDLERKNKEGDFEDLGQLKNEINSFFKDEYECVYIPSGRSMITLLTDQINYIFSSVDGPTPASIDYCTRSYVERILRIRPVLQGGLEGLLDEKLKYTQEVVNILAIKKMIGFSNEVLKGRYYYQSGEERLQIKDDRYVKVNYASSGQQEAVWIFIIMVYYLINNSKTFMVLEEPEAHLYPSAQQVISNAIGFFANNDNCVFITTHSPYILGELNNMLYASKIVHSSEKRKKILEEGCILNPKETTAFHMNNGDTQNAMADGLIMNELIDGASIRINNENDALMRLFWEETQQ